MEFREKIKSLRKSAKLTQKDAAECIGVTYRTYQNYEAGASTPSGEVLSKLSKLFGVSMEMLSGDEKVAETTENKELSALLTEMQALFSGGKLRDEDKKYVIEALTEAFYRSKEINNSKK